jgi:hypothetical protein
MTAGDGWQREDVQVHHDGDVLVITVDRAARCIRMTLTPEGIALTDAATGTVLWEQDLASIGMRYRGGKRGSCSSPAS